MTEERLLGTLASLGLAPNSGSTFPAHWEGSQQPLFMKSWLTDSQSKSVHCSPDCPSATRG